RGPEIFGSYTHDQHVPKDFRRLAHDFASWVIRLAAAGSRREFDGPLTSTIIHMDSLAGKMALVTGAGRGIGRAIAIALAKAGCDVCITARSIDQLLAVQKEIHAVKGKAVSIQADLTRDDDIESLVKSCGPVDFLINNAGWGKRASVVRAKIEDWDQTFRLNLRAPMLLTQKLLPAMIEKAEGAIINIGSVSGKSGEADGAAYSASKFGLIGFTQSLYEEV